MLPQHPVYTTKLISLNQTEHKGIFPKNQPQTTHGSHLKFTKKKTHNFRSSEDGCPATLTILTRLQRHYDIWWQKFPLLAVLGPSCELENSEYYSLKCYSFYWKGQNKQNLCITSVRPYVIAQHEGTQKQRNEFSWNFILENITKRLSSFVFLKMWPARARSSSLGLGNQGDEKINWSSGHWLV